MIVLDELLVFLRGADVGFDNTEHACSLTLYSDGSGRIGSTTKTIKTFSSLESLDKIILGTEPEQKTADDE